MHRLRSIARARRSGGPRFGASTALGALLVVAAFAAGWVWPPRPASSGARSLRPVPGPIPVAPQGEVQVVERFAWRSDAVTGRPWTVRVFDAEFVEIGRVGPVDADANSVAAPPDLQPHLRPGTHFYWVVESCEGAAPVRSAAAVFAVVGR